MPRAKLQRKDCSDRHQKGELAAKKRKIEAMPQGTTVFFQEHTRAFILGSDRN